MSDSRPSTIDPKDQSSSPVIEAADGASDFSHDHDLEKQPQHLGEDNIDEKQDSRDPDLALKRKTSAFEHPPMKKAIVIMLSIYLCVFLVALDRTIIGTAIPKMTDEFYSFDDIGWYGSSYMITTAGEIDLDVRGSNIETDIIQAFNSSMARSTHTTHLSGYICVPFCSSRSVPLSVEQLQHLMLSL